MSSLGLDLERIEFYNHDYKLDLGAVLGRALRAWGAQWPAFTLLALALHGPVLALQWWMLRGPVPGIAGLLPSLLSGLAGLVLTGAVTYGVFVHLSGERSDLAAILGAGLRHTVPIFGVSVLVGLATLAGFCALVVPALVVSCVLYVAVPVTVIEACGAMEALRRSSDLTRGNRWNILGLAIATGLLVGLPALALTVGWEMLGSGRVSAAVRQIAVELLVLPLQPFDGIVRAVCYHDLRTGREGAAVEDLVKVFD